MKPHRGEKRREDLGGKPSRSWDDVYAEFSDGSGCEGGGGLTLKYSIKYDTF